MHAPRISQFQLNSFPSLQYSVLKKSTTYNISMTWEISQDIETTLLIYLQVEETSLE